MKNDDTHNSEWMEKELDRLSQKCANLESMDALKSETEKILEEYQRELQDKENRLHLLRTFYEATTVTHDLKKIYQLLYDIFPRYFHHLGIDRVSLMIYDANSGTLVSDQLIGIRHRGEDFISGHQELGHSISGKCFLSGKPIMVEDCSKTDLIPEKWVKQLNLKSTASLPIKFEGKVIGVLRIDSTEKKQHFTESDIDFLCMVAEQLGIVIENASLLLERKRAEEALRKSRASFKSIVEKTRDGIIVLSKDKIVLFCNSSAARLLSKEREKMLGEPFEIALKMSERTEIRISRYNGEEGIGELRATETDWEGEEALLVIVYDVTQRSRNLKKIEDYAGELASRNAEMESDLHLAHEFQEALLSGEIQNFPLNEKEPEALRFYHRYISSGGVGGDFFDVRPLSDSSVGFLICDVMGHGVRSALVTAIIKGLIEKAGAIAVDPGLFLTELNRELLDILKPTNKKIFITAFYMVIDSGKKQIIYTCAGHPFPFIRSLSEKKVLRMGNHDHKNSPALGLVPGIKYLSSRQNIDSGDMILLFTDGVYEVFNPEGEEFGEERVEKLLEKHMQMKTPDFLDHILTEINRFSGEEETRDDICLVGVDIV